jgi:hypothetical protein
MKFREAAFSPGSDGSEGMEDFRFQVKERRG